MKELKLSTVEMFSTTQMVEMRFKPSSRRSQPLSRCVCCHTPADHGTQNFTSVTANDRLDSAQHSDDRIRFSTFWEFLFLHFFTVTLMIIAAKLRGTFKQWKEICVTAGKKEAAVCFTGTLAVLEFLLLFPRDIKHYFPFVGIFSWPVF